MKHDKIDDMNIDDIVGGIIKGDNGAGLLFDGNKIVMEMQGGRGLQTYSVETFTSSLVSQGIPAESVNKFVEMIKSAESFTPEDVTKETGLTLGFWKK